MPHHDRYEFAGQRTFLCASHDQHDIFQNMPMLNHKNLVRVLKHLHPHNKYQEKIVDYENYRPVLLLQPTYKEYQFDYVELFQTSTQAQTSLQYVHVILLLAKHG